jgi:competence protein ComEC
MGRNTTAVFGLAYIIGLLSTASLRSMGSTINWAQIGTYAGIYGAIALIFAGVMPRIWRTGVSASGWLVAGIIAILAVVYFQVRLPQPTATDISQFLQPVRGDLEQMVAVQGKVLSSPRVTRSQRVQFWLAARQLTHLANIEAETSQKVFGKAYVTVPLLQGTGVAPGQPVTVTGTLYQPQTALNPGGFDFQAYLARKGAFAGLSGRQVQIPEEDYWGWWRVRQRIIRAQVRGLGTPVGQVVSSMVLGRQAVDLPYPLRDAFIEAGLAHVLAASGFHVSLLLGAVLGLTRSYSGQTRLGVGLSVLIIYVGLTGLQPSVLRAAIMGMGALLGLATQRQVNSLGSLLLAATFLLLWNPLWIWDLGFQLSFLATLGLITTVPPVQRWFDWLPPTFATLIAVPIAVFPWVIPLQLYTFGVIPPYSILTNIAATPLVVIVSLGGMVSALGALIFPPLGSVIAYLLYYPTLMVIEIVQFATSLPGSTFALGTINVPQLLLLYGVIFLVWLLPRLRKYWWLAALFAFTLVVVPIFYRQSAFTQVSILTAPAEQVIFIQNQGETTLINSGEAKTVRYTVLPFLQQEGINVLDWAVDFNPTPENQASWLTLSAKLGIKQLLMNPTAPKVEEIQATQALPVGEEINLGSQQMRLISAEPPVLQFQLQDQTWLLVAQQFPSKQDLDISQFLETQQVNLNPDVLLWSGESLDLEWLQAFNPKTAIATSPAVDRTTVEFLQAKQAQIYWTHRDGAIQWTPTYGFERTNEIPDLHVPL